MSRWLFAVWLSLAGCSLALSGPEPTTPAHPVPQCDTGKGLVLVDGVGATLSGVSALALLGGGKDTQSYALIPAAIGVAYLAAAVHGSGAVDDCREAMAAALVVKTEVEEKPVKREKLEKALALTPTLTPALPPAKKVEAKAEPADGWGSFWKVVP